MTPGSQTTQRGSVGEWLASRKPPPPPSLAKRLQDVSRGAEFGDDEALFRSLVATAVELLREMPEDRGAALDLLAADALITYAMEAAANDCAKFDERASYAARGIASARGEATL